MASAAATPPIKFIGAVKDEWTMYSDRAEDYLLGPPIGFGASSVVYQAIFHSKNVQGKVIDIPCALKVLDLDKLPPSSLRLLTRETQLMSLSKHPNVLRVRGSWMLGHKLYIAMRLMNKGSVADVMKYSFIDGVEEEAIKCILEQALQGLNYLHVNGFIHRDIKAANFLIDEDGTVLLGDLGVAVSLSDEEDGGANNIMGAVRRGLGHEGPVIFGAGAGAAPAVKREKDLKKGKRKSFVGTPCWMAPEVISQQHYDYSADIWSLGITALELCRGRAPGSRERDLKRVLLSTVQNAPPTLDREAGKYKYSKTLKDMIEICLVKDPTKRPTAEQLLEHPFFKGTKKKSYLVNALLANLPPLSERQERRLLNSNHHHGSGKQKHHPLALGSPSLTSLGTSHSWDWTWPNLGSPRNTITRKESSTPPGSALGSTLSVHASGSGKIHSSPSSSIASLHDLHCTRPISSSGSLSHPHSAFTDGTQGSQARHNPHSLHVMVHSYSLPTELSVFEMEGEEEGASPSDNEEGEQVDEAIVEMKGRRESNRQYRRVLQDNSEDVDRTPKLQPDVPSSPADLLLQPPELFAGSQPSSTEPSTPATPLSHPSFGAVQSASNPASPKLPPLGLPSAANSPKILAASSSPNGPASLLRSLSREGGQANTGSGSVGKSKTRRLWKKVKAATPSSMMMMRSSSSGVEEKGKDKDRKSSLGAFLERTASRGSRS